jgi:hypothetical protein
VVPPEEERVNATPDPDFLKRTDEQLRDILLGSQPGSVSYERAKAILDARYAKRQTHAAERQTRATEDQARAAEDLRVFSRRLVTATWGLVIATAVLAIVTLVQIVWHR